MLLRSQLDAYARAAGDGDACGCAVLINPPWRVAGSVRAKLGAHSCAHLIANASSSLPPNRAHTQTVAFTTLLVFLSSHPIDAADLTRRRRRLTTPSLLIASIRIHLARHVVASRTRARERGGGPLQQAGTCVARLAPTRPPNHTKAMLFLSACARNSWLSAWQPAPPATTSIWLMASWQPSARARARTQTCYDAIVMFTHKCTLVRHRACE